MLREPKHGLRPTDPLWLGAWIMLVFIVTVGFFIQARTIRDLNDTQDAQEEIVMFLREQAVVNTAAVCELTFLLHPHQTKLVNRVFAKYDIECPEGG